MVGVGLAGRTARCRAPRCAIGPGGCRRPVLAEAEAHLERGELSGRGFDRVLRMAWTVADLAGHAVPDAGDVAEALFYRVGRGSAWAA